MEDDRTQLRYGVKGIDASEEEEEEEDDKEEEEEGDGNVGKKKRCVHGGSGTLPKVRSSRYQI